MENQGRATQQDVSRALEAATSRAALAARDGDGELGLAARRAQDVWAERYAADWPAYKERAANAVFTEWSIFEFGARGGRLIDLLAAEASKGPDGRILTEVARTVGFRHFVVVDPSGDPAEDLVAADLFTGEERPLDRGLVSMFRDPCAGTVAFHAAELDGRVVLAGQMVFHDVAPIDERPKWALEAGFHDLARLWARGALRPPRVSSADVLSAARSAKRGCVLSTGFEQKSHRELSGLRTEPSTGF